MRKPIPHVSAEDRKKYSEAGRRGGQKRFASMSDDERAEFQQNLTTAALRARMEGKEKK